jgi:hypothetical protein
MDVEPIRTDDELRKEVLEYQEPKTKQVEFIDELDLNIFDAGQTDELEAQIALKLALQMLGKNTIVVTDKDRKMVKDFPVITAQDPVSAASSFVSENRKEQKILCFCHSSKLALKNKGNFICISFGNAAWKQAYALDIKYIATASMAYPEDFLRKLKKAIKKKGVRFIQIYTKKTKEPSNTLVASRIAVNSWLNPLFEINRKEFLLTQRPEQEPLESYTELFHLPASKQETITKNMNLLEQKKFWLVDDVKV